MLCNADESKSIFVDVQNPCLQLYELNNTWKQILITCTCYNFVCNKLIYNLQ